MSEQAVISGPAWSEPSASFLARVPRELCRRHLVLGGGVRSGAEVLRVATSTPPWIPGNVALALASPVTTVLDEPEAIARAIDLHYPHASSDAAEHASDLTGDAEAQAEEIGRAHV